MSPAGPKCKCWAAASLPVDSERRTCSFTSDRPTFARSAPMWITQGSPAVDAAGQETTWTTARRCAAGEATISSARRRRSAVTADFSGAAPSSARIARRSSGLPFANEYNFVVVVLCEWMWCVQFPRCCFVVMYKLMSHTNILYNICGSLEKYIPPFRAKIRKYNFIYTYRMTDGIRKKERDFHFKFQA